MKEHSSYLDWIVETFLQGKLKYENLCYNEYIDF